MWASAFCFYWSNNSQIQFIACYFARLLEAFHLESVAKTEFLRLNEVTSAEGMATQYPSEGERHPDIRACYLTLHRYILGAFAMSLGAPMPQPRLQFETAQTGFSRWHWRGPKS